MKKNKVNFASDGFTLIELLMAVLIISILAVMGITQFTNFSKDAKNATTQANLAIMRNAIGVMNAMERIRCQKTSLAFPSVGTLQTNDITGCTNFPALPVGPTAPVGFNLAGGSAVGTLAACNPGNLIDPKTNALYSVAGTGCAPAFTGTDYMSLFPMVDRPFIQNAIPNNPWQSASEITLLATTVLQDTPNTQQGAPCLDSPITFGAQTNATECGTAVLAGSGTAFAASVTHDGGWCYCGDTGQIWANTGNNNGVLVGGLPDGHGNESTF